MSNLDKVLRLDLTDHPLRDVVYGFLEELERAGQDCFVMGVKDSSTLMLMSTDSAMRLMIHMDDRQRRADSAEHQGVKHPGVQRFDRAPTSKFVGVHRCSNSEWRAEITHLGRRIQLACLSETQAARQYDVWARLLYGETAKTNVQNFPYIGQDPAGLLTRAALLNMMISK